MKTRGKVTIAAMLIVALVASMGFMPAMGASEDAPGEISGEIYASVQVAAMDLNISYSNVTPEEGTGGDGTRATYNIDGGWLRIDEGAGTVCTGNAQSWSLSGVPAGGASCM